MVVVVGAQGEKRFRGGESVFLTDSLSHFGGEVEMVNCKDARETFVVHAQSSTSLVILPLFDF